MKRIILTIKYNNENVIQIPFVGNVDYKKDSKAESVTVFNSETRKEMYSVHGVPYTIAIEDLLETQAQPAEEDAAIPA